MGKGTKICMTDLKPTGASRGHGSDERPLRGVRVVSFGGVEQAETVVAADTVELVVGDDETGALAARAHARQHRPLVDRRVVAFHARVPDRPVEPTAHIHEICNRRRHTHTHTHTPD